MKYNDTSSEYIKLKKKDLYKASSFIGSIGVWYTILGLFGIIIFLSVFLIINNFIYHYKWKKIQAEVLEDPNCYIHKHNEYNDGKFSESIKCDYLIKYIIDDKHYTSKLIQKDNLNLININNKKYIKVEYNPQDHFEVDTIYPKKTINAILIPILLILLIGTIFIIIFRDNNVVKTISTINMIKDILKK